MRECLSDKVILAIRRQKCKESIKTEARMTKVKETARALMWRNEFESVPRTEEVQCSWSKMSKMEKWTEGSLEREEGAKSYKTLKRHYNAFYPWETTDRG